jgi:dipeptidyl aminopeptidase/acylaminoacyl peptidase
MRARTLLLMTLVMLPVSAGAADPSIDGQLIRAERPAFPPFAELDKRLDSVDEAEYRAVSMDARFVLERLVYASGGLEVVAWAYRPAISTQKLPTIVFNRGSYLRNGLGFPLAPSFRRFAAAGYAVIAPAYRESEGAGGVDQVGGDDLADLMNVVPLAKQLPWADPARLYLYGESRGGMMVYQALRDGFPAIAAATLGAFTDFNKLIHARPEQYQALVNRIFPDFGTQGAAIAERRSAAHWAARIPGPRLVLHGAKVRSVGVAHALELAAKLDGREAPWELRVIADGHHTLDNAPAERDRMIVDWFARFPSGAAENLPETPKPR